MNRQGDTTKIYLDYTYDGTPIEEKDNITQLVLQLNSEGQTNAQTYKLVDSSPDARLILKDAGDDGKYYIKLTQEDSIALGRTIRFQLSVMIGTDVYSSDIGSMTVGELLRTSEVNPSA